MTFSACLLERSDLCSPSSNHPFLHHSVLTLPGLYAPTPVGSSFYASFTRESTKSPSSLSCRHTSCDHYRGFIWIIVGYKWQLLKTARSLSDQLLSLNRQLSLTTSHPRSLQFLVFIHTIIFFCSSSQLRPVLTRFRQRSVYRLWFALLEQLLEYSSDQQSVLELANLVCFS